MLKRALTGYEKALGPEHPDTLTTAQGLGILYCDRGQLTEAAKMSQRALEGYQKTLGSEHQSTVDAMHALREILFLWSWHYIFQSQEMIGDPVQALKRLVELVRIRGNICSSVFGQLGRVLLWNSDELNAQIAFQQQIGLQDGMPVYADITCDGCSFPLTCAMKRFVCKRCLDTDLCGQCYRGREVGIKEMPTCPNHSFLQIIPGILSASNKFSFFGKAARDLWLQTLKRKYS
jgi:tetratricopeptide (TPR) repeat protein